MEARVVGAAGRQRSLLAAPMTAEPCIFYLVALFDPGSQRLASPGFSFWECQRSFLLRDHTGQALVQVPTTSGDRVDLRNGAWAPQTFFKVSPQDMSEGQLAPGSPEAELLESRCDSELPTSLAYRAMSYVQGLIRPGQRVMVEGLCAMMLGAAERPGEDPYRGVSSRLSITAPKKGVLLVSAWDSDIGEPQ